MHAKLTKKINLRLDAGDLHRLFRVLGSFESITTNFPDEIIKSDAMLLLEELRDIREIMGRDTTNLAATLEVEAQYEHSSSKITLGDLLVPGEKLPEASIEEYESAPPLIDLSDIYGSEGEAELIDRISRAKEEMDQLRADYKTMFGVDLPRKNTRI